MIGQTTPKGSLTSTASGTVTTGDRSTEDVSFTQGPWEVSCGDIWAVSPFNARVKLASITPFSPMNGINQHANAHLIAAAPDLLMALAWLYSLMASPEEHDPRDYDDQTMLALAGARRAIAKAEGK